MNVTIRLNLLGWQFATFNVDLDLEQLGEDAPTRHAFDDACKRISRRWPTGSAATPAYTPRPPEEPLYVVIIDEIAALTAYVTDRKIRAEIEQLLGLLLSQGRAVGISVIAAIQDPSKDTLPLRQLYTARIGLRMTEATQTAMVLGQGAREAGAECDLIADATPGVGYVMVDGTAHPQRVRAFHVTDPDITDLTTRFSPPRAREHGIKPDSTDAGPEQEQAVKAPATLPGMTDRADRAAVINQMIRRARSAGFNAWWQRIEAVGFCANPIHLAGPDELGREHQVFTRCNNRRAIVCPSCSDLYSRDTWQLIHAGLRGGHHDIPVTVADHPQVFVTLTAPSFGAVHTARAAGTCHPRQARHRKCPHGKPQWCNHSHNEADSQLGQPLCHACYDYVAHVMFSWHAPELWHRFTIRLRRLFRREVQRRAEPPEQTRISFMKVVELQRRALPHFHAVIRLDANGEPGEPPLAPDTTVSAQDFVVLVRQAAIETALAVLSDKTMRFGEQIDIKINHRHQSRGGQ